MYVLYTHTGTHTQVHTQTHTGTHKHTHTYTHMHTHIHTCAHRESYININNKAIGIDRCNKKLMIYYLNQALYSVLYTYPVVKLL